MAALVTPAGSSAVSELVVQGRDSAAVLEALLRTTSSPHQAGIRDLAAEILRCCDRALAALHAADGDGAVVDCRKRKSGPGGADAQTRPRRRARASSGETTARVERRRTAEDGFIWRKYGQKEIHNSAHPRLYFRCTYKHDSGCPATRQVQQSEDDPSLYVITYFADHTCCQGAGAGAVAALEADNVKMQPFVINFGAASTSAAGSPWLSSPNDTDGGRRRQRGASRSSSQAVCSPEEFGVKDAKVESTSDSGSQTATAELSSSAEFSCASPPAWESYSGCLDWDNFGESPFDCVREFMDFDAISLFQ